MARKEKIETLGGSWLDESREIVEPIKICCILIQISSYNDGL